MKKIALSLLVIAASGAYVFEQAGQQPDNGALSGSLFEDTQPNLPEPTTADRQPAPAKSPTPADLPILIVPGKAQIEPAIEVAPPVSVEPMPVPSFRLAPATITRAAMTIAASAGFVDGTYTGPAADAYYGIVQIQAVVKDGRLAGIKVLQYPSDRRTSVSINRQALPMLRDEAVIAQSANVDIITGATLTSRAFVRSLDGALAQAR